MALPKQEFIISAKDETKQAFDSVIGSVTRVTGLLSGLGSIGLGTALVASVKSAADFADEMGKAAQKVGVTTEAISGLKYAADLSDVSFETLQIGLKKLSSNAFEAADGNKALAADFKRLGIDVLSTNGALKSSDTVLLELATKFAGMKDGAEKTALAVKLLGKSGSELIPFLNGGAAGIKQLTDEASQFGLVVTNESARAAEEFNDNLTRITAASRGVVVQFGNEFIPTLGKTAEEMVRLQKEGNTLLAILRGFAGVGAAGLDVIFGKVTTDVSSKSKIKELNNDVLNLTDNLKKVKSGGLIDRALYGSSKEIEQKLIVAKNQLEAFKKFGEQLDKRPDKIVKPAAVDAAFKQTAPAASTGKSQAQRDAESAAKAAQAFTDKLVEQAKTLGLSDEALLQYDLSQQKLNASQLATARSAIVQISAFKQQQQAIKDAAADDKIFSEGDDRQLQQLEEQGRVEAEYQAARDANYETFVNNQADLNDQLNIDLIGSDTKRAKAQLELENERAIERIQNLGLENDEVEQLLNQQSEIYAKQTEKIGKKGKDDFADLQRAIRGFGDDAAKLFVDFATTGKASFGDLIDSILKDLSRLALQKAVLDPIFKSFESFVGGIDFGSIFSGFSASANGNVFSGAGISQYSNSVVSSPTLFPFAKGVGLMGEAGPEAILPLTRVGGKLGVQASGGGSNVTVNIIGAQSQPKVKESRDQNGGMTIDVVFEQAEAFMAKRVSSGAGPLAGVMEGRYGLSPSYGAAG